MKFIIAVVMLAAVASASIAPLALSASWAPRTIISGPAISYAAAPAIHSAYHVAAAPAAVSYSHQYSTPLAYAAQYASPVAYSAPIAYAAPVAHVHPVAHAVPVAVAAEGTYTAATPGAVHTAPLPGHINSVVSDNSGPAPGTW